MIQVWLLVQTKNFSKSWCFLDYFADDYEVKQYSISGMSPDDKPSAKTDKWTNKFG